MSSIAIITDTDSSLPANLAAKNDIRMVPINIHFEHENFEAGITINDSELFERIDRVGALPTTSAPAPGQFVRAYQDACDAGASEIICFCVSSQISSTYTAAVTACELMPNIPITVVDTNTLSMSQGFMVLAAAEAAQAGAGKDEIIAYAKNIGERSYLFGALSSLKYIAMSGRVGHLAANVAGLLNIKPILGIQNGKLDVIERVRTQKKAWAHTIELAAQALDGRQIERMALVHVNAHDRIQTFGEQARATLPCPKDIIIADLTPGLAVHTGAGIVGLTVVASNSS